MKAAAAAVMALLLFAALVAWLFGGAGHGRDASPPHPTAAAPKSSSAPLAAVPTPSTRTAVPALAADGVHGVVVDRGGQGVPGAAVAVVSLAAGRSTDGRSDDDGAFALTLPASGELQLVVRHPDFLAVNTTLAAAPRDGVRVQLMRRPHVRGRVRRSDGAAVAMTAVALVPFDPDEPPRVAVAPPPSAWRPSADGAFDLEAGRDGPHALQAFAFDCPGAQVLVDLVGDIDVVRDVTLDPGVRVRGRVRDADARGVAEATVEVAGATAVVTDADGAFELPPLAAGDYLFLVQHQSLPGTRREVQLRRDQPAQFVELTLPRGAGVRGRVEPWGAGRYAQVVIVHRDGPTRAVPVDPDTGTFAATDLTPGPAVAYVERLEATWRNHVARALRGPGFGVEVELPGDVTTEVVAVDPVATMARVHGRVAGLDDPSRVVVRAYCESRPLPASIEGLFRIAPAADGSFELDGFVPGSWRLQVMAVDQVLAWDVVALPPGGDIDCALSVR